MESNTDLSLRYTKASTVKPGVYLIGAGPGAEDLITVRGAHLLGKADIVFYDALINPTMLDWCTSTNLVQVGKRCGSHSTSQRFINKQLVDAALKYKVVVRLKGGDPLVFGRAQEEIDALDEAGVYFEVVPGITTALAASAELKQPPTSREISRTLTLTTMPSRCAYPDSPTSIYYMGRDQLTMIANTLLIQGYSMDTPVCLVESVSLPTQRFFSCELGGLLDGDAHHHFSDKSPVIVMVGEVYRKVAKKLNRLNTTDRVTTFLKHATAM